MALRAGKMDESYRIARVCSKQRGAVKVDIALDLLKPSGSLIRDTEVGQSMCAATGQEAAARNRAFETVRVLRFHAGRR